MNDKGTEVHWPVQIPIQIRWGDMDTFQHVNNVHFARYFECARIEYFDQIGFAETMAQTGIGPILASQTIDFKLPLTHRDEVVARARIGDLHDRKFSMEYDLVKANDSEDLVANCSSLIVVYDYHNKQSVKIPESVAKQIAQLQPEL